MNKKVILIRINNPEDMKIAPMGLLYIGGALKKAGFDVKINHLNSHTYFSKAKEIAEENPLFIGFSVITGEQVKYAALFSKELKKINPNLKIVWGGVHSSLLPGQCASESYIDYVVIGEGEETIVELAKKLQNSEKIQDIRNLAFKNKDKIVVNPLRPLIENLDKYELDYSLVNIEDYLDSQWDSDRILTFITSRGCIFNCNFCYNQKFNQRRWRPHSEKYVINSINKIKEKYKIDGIRFQDDFLFANPTRAVNIVKSVNLPWRGEMTIRTVMNNPNIYKTLTETRCREAFFGFESGNDRVLKMINKQQTVAEIRKAVEILAKGKGYHIDGSFILGLPGETKQEVYDTIDFALDMLKITPELRYTFGFYLPYPGTVLYDTAVKMGFNPPKKTEDWEIVDRWTNKMKLTWLDWTDSSDFFFRIRQYMNLLPLKDLKIPFIKDIPEKRLRTKDFSHTMELKILTALQRRFANRQSLFRRAVQATLPFIKK